MIIETKVYSCRKCQSEDLVKNGENASGSLQYHCKAVVPMAYLSAQNARRKKRRKIQYARD